MKYRTYIDKSDLPEWLSVKDWENLNFSIYKLLSEWDGFFVENNDLQFYKNNFAQISCYNNIPRVDKEYSLYIMTVDIVCLAKQDVKKGSSIEIDYEQAMQSKFKSIIKREKL